ncbi:ABC transporter transmembrane domain-containing protein [Mycetocola spongiae]|uniref:ABC transporter transmembrane domain-containing protein n=1 Tax=Mycetocola spongiae TaxID=2859226 RepID=UPI001CF31A0D|nr:ABC transporter ATP-binding protein [Mycetocola spongiae]UCR89388.1 ABC transporter ATP-binding protein/permease [Mycetocola spongiae]
MVLPTPSAPPQPADTPWTGKRILRTALISEGRGQKLSGASLGFILHQATEALVPVVVGVVIDRAIGGSDLPQLLLWLGILGLNFLVLSLSWQWAARMMVDVYGYGAHDLRSASVLRVLHPRGVRGRRGSGDLLSVTASDTARVSGVSWSITEQIGTLSAIAVSTVSLLIISLPLGLGVIAATLIVLGVMHVVSRPLERRGYEEQAAAASAGAMAADLMEGLRVLSGMGAEAEAARRYRLRSRGSAAAAVRAARSLAAYEALSTALSAVFLAATALAAGAMALSGQITVGQLVAVVGLAQFLQGSLAHVGTFGANWAHKRASVSRVRELLAAEFHLAEDAARPAAGEPEPVSRLEFGGVDGDLLVEILPGELVGVRVAEARDARALSDRCGLRADPAEGALRVNGVPADALGIRALRERIFAPPHAASVFSGTLHDNLSDALLDERSLRAAALDDVIDGLGGSARGEVGERGSRLSGGQRQRVILGRALHRPHPLLVLDEPTTSLDAVTETTIARRLREHPATLIVITTSPVLLAACHRVIDATSFRMDASA